MAPTSGAYRVGCLAHAPCHAPPHLQVITPAPPAGHPTDLEPASCLLKVLPPRLQFSAGMRPLSPPPSLPVLSALSLSPSLFLSPLCVLQSFVTFRSPVAGSDCDSWTAALGFLSFTVSIACSPCPWSVVHLLLSSLHHLLLLPSPFLSGLSHDRAFRMRPVLSHTCARPSNEHQDRL